MEKVKITVEQEQALKYFYQDGCKLSDFISCKDDYTEDDSYYPLQTFTPIEFSLLLNSWYEVEQSFEVGDWVKWDKFYGKVVEIKNNGILIDRNKMAYRILVSKAEKVTEPWKIMLLELGREKPEFKVGDKYELINSRHYIVNNQTISMECLEEDFKKGYVKYFHPVESRIEVPKNV